MIRRIAQIPCTLANISAAFDNFALGLPQIYDSACISAAFRINTGTAAPLLDSFFSLVQG
jgi:homoserine kinase